MPSPRKRKVCDNGDNNSQQNKEEKVVIGRHTFARYAKLKSVERNVPLTNEFRTTIALEWGDLDPTEKAKFFVPRKLASNATPKDNENSFKCSGTLITRCSPQRFHDIVSQLSKDQIEAVKEMGFGTLVQLSCQRLRRDLCRSLIDKFDTESCIIELHGTELEIHSSDFQHIMGVPEGGLSVDINGSIEDDHVKPMHDYYFGTSENISIADLIKKVEETKAVDDNFRVGFMLLALGTLLCPNTSIYIHAKYLIPLREPNNIKTLNWASFLFGYLVKGVRSFKQNPKSKYLCGCVLFFQLYYYNRIAHGRSIIDCSKPVVAAWEGKKSSKLLRWISRKGGFKSSSDIDLVSNSAMRNEHGVKDAGSRTEDIQLVKNCVSDILKSIEELKSIVVGPVPEKVLEELKELKDLLKSLKMGVNDGTMKEGEADQNHQINGLYVSLQAKESQVNITKIKREMSSPEMSPSDPLLGFGDKLERLTSLLTQNKSNTIVDIGPFKGCRNLSEEEVDLMSFIYLDVDNPEFVVFSTEYDEFDRQTVRCLEPGGHLSNVVINATLNTIRKSNSSNWFCSPYFTARAIKVARKASDEFSEWCSNARKKYRTIFGDTKLEDCNMIFLPILDEETKPKHWFLMVVNIASKEVEIWDTAPTSRTEARTQLVHRLMWALDGIFAAEINASFTRKWSFCTFTVRHPLEVPKQPNDFDCGMYMLSFILDFENAWLIGDKFDSVNERVQLTLRLLRHPDNLALDEIYKAMKAESPQKVIQPSEYEESRGTSVNRKTKTLQQLDGTLRIDLDVNKNKKCAKKTRKKIKVERESPIPPAKRGRGRPPGSQNKSTRQSS